MSKEYEWLLDNALTAMEERNKTMQQHTISTGNGPIERGAWPYAQCTCGWYTTNKDDDQVHEDVVNHIDNNAGAKLA